MRIRILQSAIAGEVAALSSSILAASAASGTQSGIRIDAVAPDTITLAAFNARDHAEFTVKGDVVEAGSIVVAADKAFPALVNSLSGQELELSREGSGTSLKIKVKGADYAVPTLVSGDWPDFPEPEGEPVSATVATEGLLKAIQKASKAAASNEQKRPILEGMLFEFSGDTMVLSATDSYCMAVSSVPAKVAGDAGCVVHSRSLGLLSKMSKLIQASPELEVGIDGSRRVVFTIPGRFRLACSVMGDRSKFPNISGVMPKVLAVDVVFDRREFLASYKRVALFLGDTYTNPVVMAMDDVGIMTMSAEQAASSVGTARESIASVETHLFEPDEEYRIGINSRLLADGIGLVEGDAVRLRCTPAGGTQLMLITEEGEEYPGTRDFYLAIAFRLK